MKKRHNIQASSKWWVYQVQEVYLRQLATNEITKEQYDKDLAYLDMLVAKTIKDGERFTFNEFMQRIFK